jgi:hypothetical protein
MLKIKNKYYDSFTNKNKKNLKKPCLQEITTRLDLMLCCNTRFYLIFKWSLNITKEEQNQNFKAKYAW